MANANALGKPMTPSTELSAVIGPGPYPRAEATSKLWSYIKDNGCQNPENRREIVADNKLQAVFGCATKATMFEVPKHLNRHLTCLRLSSAAERRAVTRVRERRGGGPHFFPPPQREET
jgi:chromatin remodeling complex protein RSC6